MESLINWPYDSHMIEFYSGVRTMKKLIITGLVLLLSAFANFAQTDDAGNPNDPDLNPNANACFEGGTMAGKCNQDIDGDGLVEDYEINWAWECGWYAIRYDAGIFAPEDIPARCATTVQLPPHYDVCYQYPYGSIAYIGPENTKGNIIFFNSQDCTGSSYLNPQLFIVFADTQADANVLCAAQGNLIMSAKLYRLGYNSPANVYGCLVA